MRMHLTLPPPINVKTHSHTQHTQDGIDAIRDVVYHVETFDVTTIHTLNNVHTHSHTQHTQDGIDAIRDVVYRVETFDVTTIHTLNNVHTLAHTTHTGRH